jgi:hypothetical protein
MRRPRACLDQGDGVLHDLLCQFSGGAQHQGAGFGRLEVARVGRVFAARFFGWCFAAGQRLCGQLFGLQAGRFGRAGLLLQQLLQQGQQEGGGLAAAGLARHHQVVQRRMVVAVPVPASALGTTRCCTGVGWV